jgi:hypothetical protein
VEEEPAGVKLGTRVLKSHEVVAMIISEFYSFIVENRVSFEINSPRVLSKDCKGG